MSKKNPTMRELMEGIRKFNEAGFKGGQMDARTSGNYGGSGKFVDLGDLEDDLRDISAPSADINRVKGLIRSFKQIQQDAKAIGSEHSATVDSLLNYVNSALFELDILVKKMSVPQSTAATKTSVWGSSAGTSAGTVVGKK